MTPIIALLNKVIAAVGKVITVLFVWLPDTPFQYELDLESSFISYINYVIPVSDFVLHMSLFVSAVAMYYVVRIALRWVKAIE